MPQDTATLALNGEVYLDDFSKAMGHLLRLMNGLSASVAKDASIDWQVNSLETGSAIVTLRGVEKRKKHSVAHVIKAFEDVGRAAQKGKPIPFGKAVQEPFNKLRGLLSGRITSLRLETELLDAEVFSLDDEVKGGKQSSQSAFGAVEGRIQSLSSRGALRFTLYDASDDHAVSCYLRAGSEDVMRNSWGKMACVEGILRRDPYTGKVSTVRDVSESGVEIIESHQDWREAIGCAPAIPGSMSPEDAIRKGRDE